MPVGDLGDYDVQPVEGNPFGSMAADPSGYDVAPVDHDPFAAPDEFGLASRQPEATPSSAGGPPLNPGDRDLLIKTVYGEARGEPPLGQAGVAHAILNRVKAGGYGQGISGVVKAPAAGVNPRFGYHEFSPWNPPGKEGQPAIATLDRDRPADYARVGDIVDKVYSGLIPDPTGGATHYYGRMRGHPKWSPPLAAENQVRIGGTTFVGRESGPGQSGYRVATGYQGGGGVTDLGEADDATASQLATPASPLPAPVPDAPPPMTSKDVLARGGLGSISAASFSPSDTARQAVQMGLEGAGMSRGTAQDISGNFATEAGALPVSGQLLSGADALYHAGRGEYGEAALSGVGAVPDVGPLAHGFGAMFLGPVARFADREGLGVAKTALQAGEHPYDVWSQHLWEQGPGDSWRTEIADPTWLRPSAWGQHGETKTVGDVYSHPELYKNYPGLDRTPVDFIGGEHLPPGAQGAYDESNDRFLMNADLSPEARVHTLTHELQHKVQMIEGWPGGADPSQMEVHKAGTPGNFALNFILNRTTPAQRREMGRQNIIREAQQFAYETKAGEAQAENPFARLGMSMPERRAIYPATTEQVPRGNQWWTDPTTGKLNFGQDVEPPEDEWDQSVNAASRIMSGRASGGGVTDLGEVDDTPFASNANTDYQGPEGESGGAGQGSAALYPLGRPGGGGGATGILGSPGEAPSALPASDPIADAQARATEAAGRYSPVTGLPQKPIQLKDGSFYVPGPIATAHQAAEDYMRSAGLPYDPPTDYAKLDKARAGRIAQAFDEMPHDPYDPAVRSAYEALAQETMAQYQHVKGTGLKIDYITPDMADPYADNPREAIKDIRDNNHWWVYPTESGYGAEGASAADENPMLRPSGETISGRPTLINDIFRVVHDYFGHAKEGHGFRAEGEENAWRSHMAMYSPEAIPAATTELRGQNSWLNYGPYGESNRTAKAADTVFAEQKLGLMPDWTWKEGGPGAGGAMRPLMAPQLVGRPATSLVGEEEHLMRQREGLEPAGQSRPTEWTGGRIFARAFGGGITDQNEALRRRIEFLKRPRYQSGGDVDPDPNAAGFSALDKMVQEGRASTPEPAPALPPEAPKVYGGAWGQSVEDAYQYGMGKLGEAQDWLGGGLEKGVTDLASATGVPNPELLGRDVRSAVMESPVGFSEMAGVPRPPSPFVPRVGEVGSDVAHAAAPGRAQIMDINGVKRHIDPEFPESRVGTAVPSNEDPNAPIDAEQAAHANNDAHVGMELAAQAPSHGKAVANMVRSGRIPYVKVAAGASDAVVQEALIEHMKNNLLGLYNRVSGAVRSGSKLWYEGANTRSRDIAVTHDIPHENAAGVVAAMSPQKDWDQNVTLADWVAHTAGTTADDATMSPEMTAWVNKYALRKDSERVVTDPATGKQTRFNARTGEQLAPNSVSREDVLGQLAEVDGKPWGQMTPEQKAFYTRAYYEAHGPPDHLIPTDDQTGEASHWVDEKGDHKYGYYINNPDGTHDGVLARYTDEYPNKVGQPIPVSWGSTSEVSNAIKAFGAQSMGDISEALGDGHKVRSFFNNIIAPWSKKGDVTSDTHAVAAALLRPLGAGSPEAASGMGAASPTNNATGLKGFYPHVAEAYRRAAKAAGVLPRELQSITWEALRGLWSPREKMAKSNARTGFTSQTDITNGIWQRYHNNEITMQDAHNAILGPQGERIRSPRWFETFQP